MPHASEEFRYSTRDLQVQRVLKAALFFYAREQKHGVKKHWDLAIREYNKLAKLEDKRRKS